MRKLLAMMAALALALALAGCAGNGTLSSKIDDETGAYVATAQDAGKDSGVGSLGGGIAIEEGQVLVVSPNLEKGKLTLRLLDAAGEVALELEATGAALESHELESGEYSIGVTCDENGTTGTLTVLPMDRAEFDSQQAEIQALIDSITQG